MILKNILVMQIFFQKNRDRKLPKKWRGFDCLILFLIWLEAPSFHSIFVLYILISRDPLMQSYKDTIVNYNI